MADSAPELTQKPFNMQPANAAAPEAGSIVDGYRFKGGDPANPDSWEPAN